MSNKVKIHFLLKYKFALVKYWLQETIFLVDLTTQYQTNIKQFLNNVSLMELQT